MAAGGATTPGLSSSPGPVEIATPASPVCVERQRIAPTRRTLRGRLAFEQQGGQRLPKPPLVQAACVSARETRLTSLTAYALCYLTAATNTAQSPRQRGPRAPRLPDTAGRRVRRPPRRVLSRQRPGDRSCLARNGSPGKRCPRLPRTTTLISAVRGVVDGHRSGQYYRIVHPGYRSPKAEPRGGGSCSSSARARLACET